MSRLQMVEIEAMGRVGAVAKIAAAACLVAATAVAIQSSRRKPATFIIDHGGTYAGTWESDDRNAACVRIETDEPVIIENSTVRGPGILVVSNHHQAKITIRNTRGIGTNTNA